MPALRLIDALQDFGAPSSAREAPVAAMPIADALPDFPPQPDISEIIRREVRLAEESLTMRLSVTHEAALMQQQQDHAVELEAIRSSLGEQAGRLIAERLGDARQSMTDHVGAAVARLVGAMLTEDLRRRSIESLAHSIDQAMRDAEAVRVDVRGPQALFATLAAALGDRAANLHFTETDSFDLGVTIDGALFETRIAEWSAVLSQVLA